MIREIAFSLLFTCASLTGFTQLQLEVFTGISSSKLTATDTPGSNSIKRLTRLPCIGALVDLGLNRSIRIETGLIYLLRGSKIVDDKIALDFIDIPFTFVAQTKDFRIFFGPQISVLTNARTKDFVITEAFEKSDWGLRYGIGYELEDFAIRFVIQNGLRDIYKDPQLEWKSNSISLNFGYIIKKFDRSKYIPDDPLKDLRKP